MKTKIELTVELPANAKVMLLKETIQHAVECFNGELLGFVLRAAQDKVKEKVDE